MISWKIRYFFVQPANIIRTIFTIGQKVGDDFLVLGHVAPRQLFFVEQKCVTIDKLKNFDVFHWPKTLPVQWHFSKTFLK